MTPRIDERLNLIIPVDRLAGGTAYIHANPIGRDVFETYWLTLAKTFAAIWQEGLNEIAGPKVAALMLRHIAEQNKTWDGPAGVSLGLMGEIRRLTNVVAPGGARGWDIVPLDQAVTMKLIDIEDVPEIEGVLVFFSVTWHLNRQSERLPIMDVVAKRLDASMSSQTLSAFVNSLPTSIATGSTGATPLAA